MISLLYLRVLSNGEDSTKYGGSMAFLAKRKHPRRTTRDGVKILGSQGPEFASFEDLSAGGIRLFMDRNPEIGEQFDVELRLAGMPKSILLKAKVIWSKTQGRQYEVGSEFIEKNDKLESLLIPKTDAGSLEGPF